MKRSIIALAATVGLVLGGATYQATDSDPAPKTNTQARTLVGPGPYVDKIVVYIVENHSYDQMKSQMPWLWSQSLKYGYATKSYGNTHPSQPNYIVMAAGSRKGVTSNSSVKLKGDSIFRLARKAGKTAKTAAQGMKTKCNRSGTSPYGYRHNPEVSFTDATAVKECKIYNYDYAAFPGDVDAGRIGNIHFVIPDNNHNGHDKSLKVADDWIKDSVNKVKTGPDYASGRLAIIITADEDDKKSGQHILTTVIHESQNHNVVTTKLTHYSLNRTLARVVGLQPMTGLAEDATDLAEAFGLPLEMQTP